MEEKQKKVGCQVTVFPSSHPFKINRYLTSMIGWKLILYIYIYIYSYLWDMFIFIVFLQCYK